MKTSKKLQLFVLALISIILVACGGGSQSGTTKPTEPIVELVAPIAYPIGSAQAIPVIVNNIGTVALAIESSTFNIANNTTGSSNITIDTSTCNSSLAAGARCTITVHTPQSANAGTFTIKANNNQAFVTIGLVDLPINNESGVKALTILYPNKIVSNEGSSTHVYVTCVVTSPNIGTNVNNIELVDSSGNQSSINLQTFGGLTVGSVIVFNVTIPHGVGSYSFAAQLVKDGSKVGVQSNTNIITVIYSNINHQAIVQQMPSNFNLNKSLSSQVITVTNTGNKLATNITPIASDSSLLTIESNGCASSLESGASCSYIVSFDATKPVGGSASVNTTYNNGESVVPTNPVNLIYVGRNPIAGLSVYANPDTFSSTTAYPTATSVITITNTGESVEDHITPTVPDTNIFTLSAGTTNSCASVDGFSLNAGSSCTLTLTYTNNVATSESSGSLGVSYTYHLTSGGSAKGTSDISITWVTTQSEASLAITPLGYNFGAIHNNNVELLAHVFVVTNNGAEVATNVAIGGLSAPFSKVTNCGSSLAVGESCSVTLQFGPTVLAASSESGTFGVSYAPYAGATATYYTFASFTGSIASAGSAIIGQFATVVGDGFINGDGTSGMPYQIIQDGTGSSLTATFRNTGLVPATNFYMNTTMVSGYTITNNCGSSSSKITLASNATCIIVFTPITTAIGANDLNLSLLTASWNDEAHPTTPATQGFNGITYVNIYHPVTITLTGNPSSVYLGENFMLTAILSGGYNEVGHDISLTTNPVDVGIATTPCTLSSLSPICTITITPSLGTILQSYTFSVTDSKTSTITPDSFVTQVLPKKWLILGEAGFSAGAADYISLAINADGTPYVAYQDGKNDLKATVMKFDGKNWVSVGDVGFSLGQANYTSLAISPLGVPYVAYQDGKNDLKATVMKFDGKNWVSVGDHGVSAVGAGYPSLAIDADGTPYVAYQDGKNDLKATVMKFNGKKWVSVGDVGFSAGAADWISLAINADGTPYVAYQDGKNDLKATVMKFDGKNWVSVGDVGFSAGAADYISLAINADGTPYVAYQDGKNDLKATVMKFDGNNWVSVGDVGFSLGQADYTSLAISPSGVPYIVYKDYENKNKEARVMKFDGKNWVSVGSIEFLLGQADYTNLVIDSSEVPYIAYVDGKNNSKATVMYLPY